MTDKRKFNNAPKGEASHNAKLRESDVREIKKRLAKGERSTEIGFRFKVSRSTIENIKKGTTWRHLNE